MRFVVPLPKREEQTNWLDSEFKWRTHSGHYMTAKEMATAHLFNAVVLIWNHTTPEWMKFRPFKEWHFEQTASERKQALRIFIRELTGRKDLTEFQRNKLFLIHKRLTEHPDLLRE